MQVGTEPQSENVGSLAKTPGEKTPSALGSGYPVRRLGLHMPRIDVTRLRELILVEGVVF
jgi:hypothetical protein